MAITITALSGADVHDWNSLARIKVGRRIQVVQTDKTSVVGDFIAYSESAITMKAAAGDVSISRNAVVRVSVKPRGRRARNALIGVGIGAATLVIIIAAQFSKDVEAPGYGSLLGVVAVGAGVGGAAGAAIPPGSTVYRARQFPPGTPSGPAESVP